MTLDYFDFNNSDALKKVIQQIVKYYYRTFTSNWIEAILYFRIIGGIYVCVMEIHPRLWEASELFLKIKYLSVGSYQNSAMTQSANDSGRFKSRLVQL